MISRGQWAASASATAVLPTAVGPTRTGTLPPTKPPLQLLAGQLHDRRAPVHIVRRKLRGEQPEEQLPHLALAEPVPRLDRRAARVSGREALEAVGPATEAPAGEVGHQLAEAGARVEPRVWRRHGVEDDRAAAERVGLESDLPERLGVA